MSSGGPARVAVVGGGISGLAAAWQLRRALPDLEVTVLEAGDRVGGKLRHAQLAGVRVDVGAESMLARRPEALELIDELGLSSSVRSPAPVGASIWSRGQLHPLLRGTLMGVPAVPAAALGLLDADEIARAESEAHQHFRPVEADLSVGEFVAGRVGDAVVDRLVEPLLGGVYAGRARTLSLQATVPPLWRAAVSGQSLLVTAERAASAAAVNRAPVFAGLRGGVATLPEQLLHSLLAQGVRVMTGVIVRRLERTTTGWRLVTGPVPAPVAIDADAVILATPASPSARLLREHAHLAADQLSAIDYASMAIVSFALPVAGLPVLPGSGFLVPPVDGRTIKAATFSSNKWVWLSEAAAEHEVVILRASIGRQGEEADLQRSDTELVEVALHDVAEAVGSRVPPPVDTDVRRWGGALPQYAVGHVDRVASIQAAVAELPGLEVAGAAYSGVGIPACIASGRRAADALAAHVRAQRRLGRQ